MEFTLEAIFQLSKTCLDICFEKLSKNMQKPMIFVVANLDHTLPQFTKNWHPGKHEISGRLLLVSSRLPPEYMDLRFLQNIFCQDHSKVPKAVQPARPSLTCIDG